VELEAGKSYYFLQNTFDGIFKSETSLSRNSPELVMYFLDGSYYAESYNIAWVANCRQIAISII